MTALQVRLAVLMFLQFATWGSWTPVLGRHLENLGFTPLQIGAVYGSGALAVMITPLLAGQGVDRWFHTERFLSVSFGVTAALFFTAARTTSYGTMWWLAFGAMLSFGPTLALANSLVFHQLDDAPRHFPAIRAAGTVGWIAAGWTLSGWMSATGRPIGDCLNLAAVFAALTGLYALSLPKTPPRRDAGSRFAVWQVLAMLRDPSFAIFSLLAFVLMVFATFYYFRAANFFPAIGVSDANLPVVMSIGQVMEIATMFALPAVFRALGPKRTIAIGIAAWGLRFGIFALGAPLGLVIAAQALHGVCFAFAIAGAMLYVEQICPLDARGSAQSFLSFLTYGLGMFAGAWVGGAVSEWAHGDWHLVWLVPACGCAAVLAVFAVGFRVRQRAASSAAAPAVAR